MNPEPNLGTLTSAIKADVKELIHTKIKLLRLEVFEKTSTVGSFLIYGLIVMNIVFFALLFAFIALGFLIGQRIGNFAGGFAIVTLIYLVILVFLFIGRKPILRRLQNLFLRELDPDLDNEKNTDGASSVHKEDAYEVH
jgi:hypothetical protein